jgi:hypothetical protein
LIRVICSSCRQGSLNEALAARQLSDCIRFSGRFDVRSNAHFTTAAT